MGANYIDHVFDACTPQELREKFKRLVAEERRMYGEDIYSGTFATKDSLHIEDKLMATAQSASDYVSEHTGKWEHCLAVKIPVLAGEEFYQTEGGKRYKAKIDEARRAVLDFPSSVVARTKQLTSKTKGCKKCGSSIAVAYLRNIHCPVCHHEYLYTETDLKKLAALNGRLEKANQQYNQLEAAYDAKRTQSDWSWYVGGWAPC